MRKATAQVLSTSFNLLCNLTATVIGPMDNPFWIAFVKFGWLAFLAQVTYFSMSGKGGRRIAVVVRNRFGVHAMLSFIAAGCLFAAIGLFYWWGINAAYAAVVARREAPRIAAKSQQASAEDRHEPPPGESHAPVASIPSPKAPGKTHQKPPQFITMHDLWKEDFDAHHLGAGVFGIGFAPRGLEKANGEKVEVEGWLLIDNNSATKFVSFFVPRSPEAFNACAFLADHYAEVIPVEGLHLESQQPGQGPMRSADFPFSGRIFIYYEDFFSPEQVGTLHGYYRERKLKLELRGPDYLQFETYRRLNNKGIK